MLFSISNAIKNLLCMSVNLCAKHVRMFLQEHFKSECSYRNTQRI